MVQIPAIPETDNLQIELPRSMGLSITLEQFVELEAANRDLKLERTAKGELIVNPPTGWETGNRNGRINQQLFNWADVDGTGIAFDSSTGFRLPNGAIRSPDASWVSQKRVSHAKREWRMGLCAEHRDSPLETLRERTCLDAVAHGGSPQDRAASPRPRCIAGKH